MRRGASGEEGNKIRGEVVGGGRRYGGGVMRGEKVVEQKARRCTSRRGLCSPTPGPGNVLEKKRN